MKGCVCLSERGAVVREIIYMRESESESESEREREREIEDRETQTDRESERERMDLSLKGDGRVYQQESRVRRK